MPESKMHNALVSEIEIYKYNSLTWPIVSYDDKTFPFELSIFPKTIKPFESVVAPAIKNYWSGERAIDTPYPPKSIAHLMAASERFNLILYPLTVET